MDDALPKPTVINPQTGRAICVGGATYKKLIAAGILGTTPTMDGSKPLMKARNQREALEMKANLDPALAGAGRRLVARAGGVYASRKKIPDSQLVEGALDAGIRQALDGLYADEDMEEQIELAKSMARMRLLHKAPPAPKGRSRAKAAAPAPLPRAQAHRNFVVATPAPSEYGDRDGDDAYEPEDAYEPGGYEPGGYEPGAYPGNPAYEDEPAYEDDY
jgi:hypothetical protein